MEIGCSPASWLIYFFEEFGYEPSGVEYTETGCRLSRDNLASAGIAGEIIHSDFLDVKFLSAHKEKYDVVFSAGFIEHFDNPESIVQNHVEILKKDGYLVVLIPNFRGINLFLQKILDFRVVKKHNLKIMELSNFEELFEQKGLTKISCSYLNYFTMGLFSANRNILRLLKIFQKVIFNRLKLCGPNFSPQIIYIGKKDK